MKKLALLLMLFLCTLLVPAQNAIEGIVLDAQNGEPLEGALVIIKLPQPFTTQANENGKFFVKSLVPGNYEVECRLVGYENKIITPVVVYAGKSSWLPIALKPTAFNLTELKVNDFKYEQNLLTPVSSYSFSREEIALNPGAQGDIFRAIGMLPGVTSSGGVYSAISVRGQGVRDNVYLVDDIPMTEVGHLEGNSFFNDPNGGRFSIFAPRVIDNARFVGGGFGPEYGRRSASYLGLDIKEGNPLNPLIDGQIDLLGLTLNYDGPTGIKNTSLFASARYQNFTALVNLIGLKDIGLPAYTDIILKTTTNLSAKRKLSVLGILAPESYVRNVDNVYYDESLNLLYLPDFKRNKIVGGINLKTQHSKFTSTRNVLYYTAYSSDITVGKAFPNADTLANLVTPEITYNNKLQTQNYLEQKLGYRWLISHYFANKGQLNAGLEADLLWLYNDRKQYGVDTQYTFRAGNTQNPNQLYQLVLPQQINANYQQRSLNYSAFVNYSKLLLKKLNVNVGLRYDFTGVSQQHCLAPRMSASYLLSPKASINMAMGLYYQDPVYSDVADQPAGNRLKMEQVFHLVVGYRKYFASDFKFTAEAWLKQFDNLVVKPVSAFVFANNKGTGEAFGVDLNLTKRLSQKWHGQLGYSFMHCYRNDGDGLGRYEFSFSQPHQVNFMLSYKTGQHWIFSTKYRYATGRPTDAGIIHRNVFNDPNVFRYSWELQGRNQSRLPDFSSWDIRANYQFFWRKTKFIAFVDIVNVLNHQIANGESFNAITGNTYYDGLAVFPTGGLKFEF